MPATYPEAVLSSTARRRWARQVAADQLWWLLTGGAALLPIALVVTLAVVLWEGSPTVHSSWVVARQFLLGRDWDPVANDFGALPFLYGSILTAGLALLLSAPVGLGAALFLSEAAPPGLQRWLARLTDLLAAVPSVVYGLLGLFLLTPWMRDVLEPALSQWLGFLPVFQGPAYGVGVLTAGILLAVMILPFWVAAAREALAAVAPAQREAALALGATRWETVRNVVLPQALPGLLAAGMLALGRALGETMAVTMVIGNTPSLALSLFAPGYTIPAAIANEFAEATGPRHLQALLGLAVVLLLLTASTQGAARILQKGLRRRRSALR